MEAYNDPGSTGVRDFDGILGDMSLRGFRSQGHSMVILRFLTQLLTHHTDKRLENLVDEHVDLIMNKFFNRALGVTNEYLQHDYSRVPGYEDHMFTGHSVEIMWMVLFEAIRRKDQSLFSDAKSIVRRYIEMCWDYAFEGFGAGHFYVFDGPGRTREKLYGVKTMWSHCELLVALMHILEYAGELWAKEWYQRLRAYAIKSFDTDYGVWRQAVDRFGEDAARRGTPTKRKGNFHQPRYMMLNLLSLERMVNNDGKITAFPS